MPLNAEEQQSLLAQKGIGATVLTRLQQMGLDDVAKLAAADVDNMLQQGAALSGSTCWRNSPQARAAMQTAVQAAASARYNHGLVYATNLQYNPTTQVGNPWASLPSYWSSLVGTVRAINTATALPAC